MTTPEAEKIIRDACIKANSEIVELKFGCEVEFKEKFLGKVVHVRSKPFGNGKKIDGNPKKFRMTALRQGEETPTLYSSGSISKILGRPIRLADNVGMQCSEITEEQAKILSGSK